MFLSTITTGEHTTVVAYRPKHQATIVETVSTATKRDVLIRLGIKENVADGMIRGLWYQSINLKEQPQ